MGRAAYDIDWTPERCRALADEWRAGLSMGAIAKKLGVTKNAVCGKVHRLNLPSRPSPIREANPDSPRNKRRIRAAARTLSLPHLDCMKPIRPVLAIVPDVVFEPPTPLLDDKRVCQYPFGEPRKPGFRFCEKPALFQKSWCPDCAKIVFMPSQPREVRV